MLLNAKLQHSVGESSSKHMDFKYSICLFAATIKEQDIKKCTCSWEKKKTCISFTPG